METVCTRNQPEFPIPEIKNSSYNRMIQYQLSLELRSVPMILNFMLFWESYSFKFRLLNCSKLKIIVVSWIFIFSSLLTTVLLPIINIFPIIFFVLYKNVQCYNNNYLLRNLLRELHKIRLVVKKYYIFLLKFAFYNF